MFLSSLRISYNETMSKSVLLKKLRLALSVARPPSSMDPGCHSTVLIFCVQDEETLSYIQGVAGEGQMYSWQGCRGQIQSLG